MHQCNNKNIYFSFSPFYIKRCLYVAFKKTVINIIRSGRSLLVLPLLMSRCFDFRPGEFTLLQNLKIGVAHKERMLEY